MHLHCPSEGVRVPQGAAKVSGGYLKNHPAGERIQVKEESNENPSQDVADRASGESAKKRVADGRHLTPGRSLFSVGSDWRNPPAPPPRRIDCLPHGRR